MIDVQLVWAGEVTATVIVVITPAIVLVSLTSLHPHKGVMNMSMCLCIVICCF